LLLSKGNAGESGLLSRFMAWMAAGLPILLMIGFISGSAGAGLGVYLVFSSDLPKIPDLRAYRPKTVSTFFAEDGTVIGVFYKEKRFPVRLDTIPSHVINAFLAAEDARFFSHTGVDLSGALRALVKNVKAGNFAQGGSTITQQVTRNFILSKEKKLSRKIREAILAFRLERTLSKAEILELYLNEIYLGRGAYGVEAAARTYFGKSAPELTVGEAAMLAGFVANPSKYSQARNLETSLKRRDFVLAAMLRSGFIADEQYSAGTKEEPKFRENLPTPYQRVPYFTEAVRQYIVAKYGANRLYNEGLRVWTTCDISLQDTAQASLSKGASSWEKRQGRPAGLVRRLKPAEGRMFLKGQLKDSCAVGDLVQALVMTNHSSEKRKGKQKKTEGALQELVLAFPGDIRFHMELNSSIPYRTNDLLEFRVVEVNGDVVSLEHQSLPSVQGAVVCIDNNTGYVKALVGGLDFERSSFNRAAQALRQPGSAFKPFVYTAALEWADYSPQSLIVDEPIAVVFDPAKPEWTPKNADGRYLGPITLRQALAYSRNVAAVKLLMDVGPENAIRMARKMGIQSPLERNLSLSLGTSEVTPLELTAAYTVFPNMGMRIHPVLVKRVEDRFGNVLEDNTMKPLDVTAGLDCKIEPGFREPTDHFLKDRLAGEVDAGSAHNDLDGTEELVDRRTSERTSASSTGIDSLLSTAFPTRWVARRPSMERVLSPATAYVMLSILRETCISGTAAYVSRMRRKDLAGKTGTTDDCSDAWFIGFNPKYTTGVWIGHDTKTSLGTREYGGTAALPIWVDFMTEALKNEPSNGYPAPPGIVFASAEPIPRNARSENLLEANPDFDRKAETKPLCPVDAEFVTASYQPFNSMDLPAAINFGYETFNGGVRVLSSTGQPVGPSYNVMDGWGNVTSYREKQSGGTDNDDYNSDRHESEIDPSRPRTQERQGLLPWLSNYLRRQGWGP